MQLPAWPRESERPPNLGPAGTHSSAGSSRRPRSAGRSADGSSPSSSSSTSRTLRSTYASARRPERACSAHSRSRSGWAAVSASTSAARWRGAPAPGSRPRGSPARPGAARRAEPARPPRRPRRRARRTAYLATARAPGRGLRPRRSAQRRRAGTDPSRAAGATACARETACSNRSTSTPSSGTRSAYPAPRVHPPVAGDRPPVGSSPGAAVRRRPGGSRSHPGARVLQSRSTIPSTETGQPRESANAATSAPLQIEPHSAATSMRRGRPPRAQPRQRALHLRSKSDQSRLKRPGMVIPPITPTKEPPS